MKGGMKKDVKAQVRNSESALDRRKVEGLSSLAAFFHLISRCQPSRSRVSTYRRGCPFISTLEKKGTRSQEKHIKLQNLY